MSSIEKFDHAIQEATAMYGQMAKHCLYILTAIAEQAAHALRNGKRLFFCGNGGWQRSVSTWPQSLSSGCPRSASALLCRPSL